MALAVPGIALLQPACPRLSAALAGSVTIYRCVPMLLYSCFQLIGVWAALCCCAECMTC
jgi:hypothetical protein